MKKWIFRLLTTVAALLLAACSSGGESGGSGVSDDPTTINGTPDTSFGSDGLVSYFTTMGDLVNDIAIDSNGNLYATGFSFIDLSGDTTGLILSFNPDGSANTSFNGTGLVNFNYEGSAEFGNGIAIEDTDRSYIIGSTDLHVDNDIVFLSYESNGTFNTNFDTSQMVIDGGVGEDDRGYDIVMADGIAYFTGYVRGPDTTPDLFVGSHTEFGELNLDFNGTGMVTYSGGGSEKGYGIALDATGNIYVAGSSEVAPDDEKLIILSYKMNGTPNTDFNTTGMVTYDSGDANDSATAIAISNDGIIYVAGNSTHDVNSTLFVRSYHLDGSLNTDFNGGMVSVEGSYTYNGYKDSVNDIALDGKGNVYVAVTYNQDLVVVSYDKNGSLNTDFNGEGMFVYDSGTYDSGKALVAEGNGTLYVAGESHYDGDAYLDIILLKFK